jgi:hypothetical protein
MIDGDEQDPQGENTDTNQSPVSEETAGESQPFQRGDRADASQHYPFGATMDTDQQPAMQKPSKPAAKPTFAYIAITAGVGVLVGVGFAANAWRQSNPPGPYDLGPAASSAQGLKGHLFTEWNNKVAYRLSIESDEQDQQAGFAHAVSDPPRPVSFDIRIKDPLGFVLCGTSIVLKDDPGKGALAATSGRRSAFGKTSARNAPADPATQADIARLQSQELERERGKDLFKNEIGPDGQITAISAQGEITCSRKAYENAASWSFSANFPTLSEQAEWLQGKPLTQANAARASEEAAADRKKAKRQIMASPLHFSVEGYDVVSWADASGGVLGTEGGKTFVIDKTASQGNAGAWQVYPANIHYRCDQNAVCLLTRADSTAVLHARLKK